MNDPKMRLQALAELDALHQDALAKGDTALAERIAAARAELADISPETLAKMAELQQLHMARSWDETRDALAAMDRAKLPSAVQGALDDLVAATARTGDPERAMELVMNAANDAQIQYKDAYARGDAEQAEHFSALMHALGNALSAGLGGSGDSPGAQEMEKVGKGERLLLAERWAEGRDVLASIDRSLLPLMNRPGVLNNLAYATAQAGDPGRAIALIADALKEAEAIGPDYPQEKLPFLHATHAIALHLDDKHEEAIALLEPLVAIEKPVRTRSTRAYYLGQAYRALGRTSDAARMFELAANGEGPFAKRAADALSKQ